MNNIEYLHNASTRPINAANSPQAIITLGVFWNNAPGCFEVLLSENIQVYILRYCARCAVLLW